MDEDCVKVSEYTTSSKNSSPISENGPDNSDLFTGEGVVFPPVTEHSENTSTTSSDADEDEFFDASTHFPMGADNSTEGTNQEAATSDDSNDPPFKAVFEGTSFTLCYKESNKKVLTVVIIWDEGCTERPGEYDMSLEEIIKGNMGELEQWLNPKLAECKDIKAVAELMDRMFENCTVSWKPMTLDQAGEDPKPKELTITHNNLRIFLQGHRW